MLVRYAFLFVLAVMVFADAPASSEDTPRAKAEEAFEALIVDALRQGPESVDLGELRRAYMATSDYRGSSALQKLHAEALAKGAADPMAGFDPRRVGLLAVREYPLLDAHRIAFLYYSNRYFDTKDPLDERKLALHLRWYRALSDEIVSSAVTEGDATTFKVLSVGEEYEILKALGLERTSQALQRVDGVPYDVFHYDDRTIRFDISAFFGKF